MRDEQQPDLTGEIGREFEAATTDSPAGSRASPAVSMASTAGRATMPGDASL